MKNKKFLYIFSIAVIIMLTIFIIYELFIAKETNIRLVSKAIVVLVGYVAMLVRSRKANK